MTAFLGETGTGRPAASVNGSAHRRNRLVAYRDDGPLAHAFGRAAQGQLPPLLPVVVAAIVVGVLLAIGIGERHDPVLFAPVAVLLIVAPTARHPHHGRFDWLVPAMLRAVEYAYLGVVGFANDVSRPLVFALLGILAYHHYDVVYRTRQRLWPSSWVFIAGLGWEGRMLVAAIVAVAGVPSVGYIVLAIYLGVLFGIESVVTWARTGRGRGVPVNLEEEEAGS